MSLTFIESKFLDQVFEPIHPSHIGSTELDDLSESISITIEAPNSTILKEIYGTCSFLNMGQRYNVRFQRRRTKNSDENLTTFINIGFSDPVHQVNERRKFTEWSNKNFNKMLLEIESEESGIICIPWDNTGRTWKIDWSNSSNGCLKLKANFLGSDFIEQRGSEGASFKIHALTCSSSCGDVLDPKMSTIFSDLFKNYCYRIIKVFKHNGAERKIKRQNVSKPSNVPPNKILEDNKIDGELMHKSGSQVWESTFISDTISHDIIENILSQSNSTSHGADNNENYSPSNGMDAQALTSSSTNEDVRKWMSMNGFQDLIQDCYNASGKYLLSLEKEDMIDIFGSAHGIRLFNRLHQKEIKSAKTIYISNHLNVHVTSEKIYRAYFLVTQTTYELRELICKSININPECVSIIRCYIKNIEILVDNQVITNFPNESYFSMRIFNPTVDKIEIYLQND